MAAVHAPLQSSRRPMRRKYRRHADHVRLFVYLERVTCRSSRAASPEGAGVEARAMKISGISIRSDAIQKRAYEDRTDRRFTRRSTRAMDDADTELPPVIRVHAVGKSADKAFISRYFYRIYFCRCCQLRGTRLRARASDMSAVAIARSYHIWVNQLINGLSVYTVARDAFDRCTLLRACARSSKYRDERSCASNARRSRDYTAMGNS